VTKRAAQAVQVKLDQRDQENEVFHTAKVKTVERRRESNEEAEEGQVP
jgi:hypothetical protein